jgi:pimeloyl-[acyl-carrier protein] methyl ester esterase
LGAGEEIVLLHGWGMSSRFMTPFAEQLSRRFRVTLLDLPGHGRTGLGDTLGLAGFSGAILDGAPPRAHWIGWSLGALVALQAAVMSPSAVRTLTFLAGTPRFLAAPGWPGVDESVLHRFAGDLHRNYPRTVERFLGLQLHGMTDERLLLKALRARVAEQERPDPGALDAGLAILQQTDLRGAWADQVCPMLTILGGRDRLIPVAVGTAMRALNPRVEMAVLDDAAHIPFWTHPGRTLFEVEQFVARSDA